MLTTIEHDVRLQRLLQSLLSVRHSHLRPLLAVSVGQPASVCIMGSQGRAYRGAVAFTRRSARSTRQGCGSGTRPPLWDSTRWAGWCLIDVGSRWDLHDPFRGTPTRGESDLRIAWRQQSDLLQLANLSAALLRCETLAS